MKTIHSIIAPAALTLASSSVLADTLYIAYNTSFYEYDTYAGGHSRITFSTGYYDPSSIVFSSTGTIYASEWGNNDLYTVAPNGTKTLFSSGLNAPTMLAMGTNGNVYEADFGTGTINMFTPQGNMTTIASGIWGATGLVFDDSGNLYAASYYFGTIYKITPDGTITPFATGLNFPDQLAFRNGILYEADYGSGNVYQFTLSGTMSLFAGGMVSPFGLAFDSKGDLFVSDMNGGEIYEFSPDGSTLTTFDSGLPSPAWITIEQQPSIYAISNSVAGNYTVYLANQPNSTNRLWATTNLTLGQWQVIATNVMDTNGLGQFLDTNTAGMPQKFYRLSYP